MILKRPFYIAGLLLAGIMFLNGCDDNSSGTNNRKNYEVALEGNPGEGGAVSPAYGSYEAGKELEITASPSEGYRFERWSADYEGSNKKATITVDINKKIVANFVRKQYDLTVDTTGKGSVDESPLESKTTSYPGGTRVQLSAHPETGWMFDHWEGDLSGSDNPEVITVEGPSQVTAVFTPAEYELTINAEHGAVDQEIIKSKSYAEGTKVKLTANPDQGYVFDHWEGDLSSTDNPETITINTAKTVTAVFKNKPGPIIITGFMVNAHGADVPQKGDTRDYTDKPYGGVLTLEGGFEYIQFMALRDIDFSKTPYSVVVGRHYTPHPEGWATGGSRSFKFNLTEGQAAQGTFFYVGTGAKRIDGYWDEGHSTDISDANWIRNIQANLGDDDKVAGDGFGSSTTGLLTNSKKADGIAVFKGTDVTASSVPIDAVFYGTGIDGALDGGDGYRVPEQSDLYSSVNKKTGEKQPFFGQGTNTYMYPGAGDGNFRQLGGIFTENGVIEPRGTADTYGVNTGFDTKLEEIENGHAATIFRK